METTETTALTTSSAETDAITQAEPETCLNLVVTTSSEHSQRCGNPFCNVEIEPLSHGRWRRTQRRFCNDACRYDYHAARRVQAIINKVGIVQFNHLINQL